MPLLLHTLVTETPSITADDDPNTTEPANSRIVGTRVKNGEIGGGSWDLLALLQDGTSIDVTVWVKVDKLGGEWFRLAAPVTVLDNEVAIIQNVPPDSQIFIQLTAPTGDPTAFGAALV